MKNDHLPVSVWNVYNPHHSVTENPRETVPHDVNVTFDKVDWDNLFTWSIPGVPCDRSHFEWSAERYYKQCKSCPWPNDFIANADIKGDIYEQALEDFTVPNGWLLKGDVNTTTQNFDWEKETWHVFSVGWPYTSLLHTILITNSRFELTIFDRILFILSKTTSRHDQ